MRLFVTLALAFAVLSPAQDTPELDVPYVPTTPEVVQGMLDLAEVKKGDLVYDLGCGDGRIVIAAAKRGARGVGFDIDPERIKEAQENARAEGVADRVRFELKNLFDVDISPANVVTMYLLPGVNLKLRPKIQSQLKKGSRVVSHAFDMGDWEPERREQVNGRNIYLWLIK